MNYPNIKNMKIKFKKLNSAAGTPKYAKQGDAGMDIIAISKDYDKYGNTVYGTGIAIEIPKGHVGLLFPRSSVSKTDLSLANCVGVIDSGYRGEIIAKFKTPKKSYQADIVDYRVGDRIIQLIIMPVPKFSFEEVKDLTDTERGKGGFGSTGD